MAVSPQVSNLRIEKGYLRGALYLARRFITMTDVIVYYSYFERVYFYRFFVTFITSDVSVTIYVIEMIFFYVCSQVCL